MVPVWGNSVALKCSLASGGAGKQENKMAGQTKSYKTDGNMYELYFPPSAGQYLGEEGTYCKDNCC